MGIPSESFSFSSGYQIFFQLFSIDGSMDIINSLSPRHFLKKNEIFSTLRPILTLKNTMNFVGNNILYLEMKSQHCRS